MPFEHHPLKTHKINPNLDEAKKFDTWARKNLKVEEIEDPERENKYTSHSSDKVFGAKNQDWFDLIKRRSEIVEKEYKSKKFNMVGGPKLVFKRKEYSGFSRKDIKRK